MTERAQLMSTAEGLVNDAVEATNNKNRTAKSSAKRNLTAALR